MPAVALTIAGSDPSGGAGIQADLKTFHQFGVYGEAAITLLTVQNSVSVTRVETVASDLVCDQIGAVIDDIPPAAAKTGALGTAATIQTVAKLARKFSFPLVVDPVMISKHGARLLATDAEDALRRDLLPHALLVTPNIPEAEALSGLSIETEQDMWRAADRILALGPGAVLIKGGHLAGEPVDILAGVSKARFYSGPRIHTEHTHGTGCTYSAAITACLALNYSLEDAVRTAKAFIQAAIATAPQLGRRHGPVNHFAQGATLNAPAC
jgi:hydroxymethylpyrimidine/phosphomethylpyrimidine kinase